MVAKALSPRSNRLTTYLYMFTIAREVGYDLGFHSERAARFATNVGTLSVLPFHIWRRLLLDFS